VNPANLTLYTEKPNVKRNLTSPSETIEPDEIDEEIKSKLSSYNFAPKQKFPFPATANQEVGWYLDAKHLPAKHTKKSCSETKYANDYFSMTGSSPYSKKHK